MFRSPYRDRESWAERPLNVAQLMALMYFQFILGICLASISARWGMLLSQQGSYFAVFIFLVTLPLIGTSLAQDAENIYLKLLGSGLVYLSLGVVYGEVAWFLAPTGGSTTAFVIGGSLLLQLFIAARMPEVFLNKPKVVIVTFLTLVTTLAISLFLGFQLIIPGFAMIVIVLTLSLHAWIAYIAAQPVWYGRDFTDATGYAGSLFALAINAIRYPIFGKPKLPSQTVTITIRR